MTAPADPWRDVTAARVPAAGVVALGPVRHRREVRVFPAGDRLWVRWPASNVVGTLRVPSLFGRHTECAYYSQDTISDVVCCLLPVPGVVFLVSRGGAWFPFGSRIPTADRPPDGDGLSVAAVLAPTKFAPLDPGKPAAAPVALTVVRGGDPRPASALVCRLADLAAWADTATTAELAAVTAARAGERVVLRGARLPVVPGATRYWGDDVLVPLGFRPEPDLRPAVVRAAAGADDDELVLLDESGAELVPRGAFAPATRAGLRLALAGGVA